MVLLTLASGSVCSLAAMQPLAVSMTIYLPGPAFDGMHDDEAAPPALLALLAPVVLLATLPLLPLLLNKSKMPIASRSTTKKPTQITMYLRALKGGSVWSMRLPGGCAPRRLTGWRTAGGLADGGREIGLLEPDEVEELRLLGPRC